MRAVFAFLFDCATVSLAELASANIVGYTTTSITGVDSSNEVKWYQLGIQFKGVSESSDQIKLADAISLSGVVATSNWRNRSTGPMLQFYNGTSYDMYYYVSSSVSGLEKDAWVNGMKEDASAVYVKTGDAFWFSAKSLGTGSATLTVAGSVKTEATATIEVDANTLHMGSNPFPMDVVIKDIGCSLTPISNWRNRSKGPVLQVYNGTGYDMYYFATPAASGLETTTWVNGMKEEAIAVLPAGSGFWLMTNGETGTLTFNYN